MKEKSQLLTWGALGVACLFVVVAGVSLYNIRELHRDAQWVSHTHEVIDALTELKQSTYLSQSRRWAELGEEEPAHGESAKALESMTLQSAGIVQLTADNTAQQAKAVDIQQQIPEFARLLNQIAATERAQGIEAARQLARSMPWQATRTRLISQIDEMEQHERGLLASRMQTNHRAYTLAIVLGLVAGATGLAACCLFGWLLGRYLRTQADSAAKLESQRQFLHATLTGIGDGVVVTDAQCRVTFLNPVAEALTGWPLSEANGQSIETVFHIVNESTRQVVLSPAREALDEAKIIGLANHTILIAKNGEESSIDDSAAPIRNLQGEITGVVLVFRDVSDQRRSTSALRENERRKDEFLAMLGHELRNPLAGIVTGVQVLEMLNLGGDAGEMAAIIGRQAAHMSHIVDDLLDVSRIARGKLALRRAPLEVVELLGTIVLDYQKSHIIEDCEVRFDPPDFKVWVVGDRTRLAQVMTNLLHNGCKFCDGPNTVTVSLALRQADGQVDIVVHDCGIGMTCETIQRIFEPFNQADNSVERSRGGLGLGLALVKGVIDLHGGTVRAESEGLGKGTRFILSLPLVARPSDDEPSGEQPSSALRKVLLIDDRRDAIWPVQKFLEMGGHKVETASDGPKGIATAGEFRPDVILCDIGLDGPINGYEVAKLVRESKELAATYLVAVTGYGQEEDRRTAQAAGFDYHLTKPVSRDQLQEVMARMPRF